MGHRTLIAYERDDGQYNVHYSHWGGDSSLPLYEAITEDSPLGGENMEPEYVNAMLASLGREFDGEVKGKLTEANPDRAVEPDPAVTGADLETVVTEHLDFLHHEAFYVVDRDFNVRAFRTWRLYPPEDGEPFEKDIGNGILVEPRMDDGEPAALAYTEGKFKGAYEAARSMFKTGNLSRDDANRWLVDVARTFVEELRGYDIPEFSPYGYPKKNCRENGYALTPIPLSKKLDIPRT